MDIVFADADPSPRTRKEQIQYCTHSGLLLNDSILTPLSKVVWACPKGSN